MMLEMAQLPWMIIAIATGQPEASVYGLKIDGHNRDR